eukprot:XP_020404652.1 uncharacterized protein LOC109944338 [Zea mays]
MTKKKEIFSSSLSLTLLFSLIRPPGIFFSAAVLGKIQPPLFLISSSRKIFLHRASQSSPWWRVDACCEHSSPFAAAQLQKDLADVLLRAVGFTFSLPCSLSSLPLLALLLCAPPDFTARELLRPPSPLPRSFGGRAPSSPELCAPSPATRHGSSLRASEFLCSAACHGARPAPCFHDRRPQAPPLPASSTRPDLSWRACPSLGGAHFVLLSLSAHGSFSPAPSMVVCLCSRRPCSPSRALHCLAPSHGALSARFHGRGTPARRALLPLFPWPALCSSRAPGRSPWWPPVLPVYRASSLVDARWPCSTSPIAALQFQLAARRALRCCPCARRSSTSLLTHSSLFPCLPRARISSARHSVSSSRTIIASITSSLATFILTVSAHDCGRVHRIRQRFVADSTVVVSRVVEPVVFPVLYSRGFLLAGAPSRLARL